MIFGQGHANDLAVGDVYEWAGMRAEVVAVRTCRADNRLLAVDIDTPMGRKAGVRYFPGEDIRPWTEPA